ncbi:MAG: hypothetical protein HY361_04845 [Candidatus Aenigmarchaeota archaeon]|nr:hypothetical protein [Candidatus Aenigmarchaeota archaeon]
MISIDINVKDTRMSIESSFGRTISRIGKCVHIKKVALEKIRTFKEEDRIYGFTHLYKLSKYQISNYTRYIEGLKRIFEQLILAREPVNTLVPFKDGFFAKRRFNWVKNNLSRDIDALTEYFESIEGIIKRLIENLRSQSGLIQVIAADTAKANSKYFKSAMTGQQETELIRLVEEEIKLSEELANKLENSKEIGVHFLSIAEQLQNRLIDFFIALSEQKAREFRNVMNESDISFESICDKIEKNMSGWYAIKTVLVLVGFGVGLLYPDKQVSQMGFIVGGGALGIDFIMDLITGIPASRRKTIQLKNKIISTIRTNEEVIANISRQLQSARKSVGKVPDFL